jgi:uncharacterized protein
MRRSPFRVLFSVVVLSWSLALHAQQAQAQTAPAAAPAGSPTVEATPALWEVKGPHATVYLFGTVHLMKPDVSWHTSKVNAAVAASQTLIEEIPDVDQPPAVQAELMQLGMDLEHPLSTKVTKDDLARIDAAAKQMGLPGESALEPMRPWMVGITLSTLPLVKAGYDPESGVDVTLAKEFRKKGKANSGLETVDQQLHFFADMPQADEVASLHVQLQHLDTAQADLETTVTAWEKGDVETIAKVENGEMRKDYPSLYQRLVVERNKAWTEKIAATLAADGPDKTVLVAVGAAHLAGPDSVQAMLAAKGYTVKPL